MRNLVRFETCNKFGSYDALFEAICREMKINLTDDRFVYFLDMDCVPDNDRGVPFDNISIDYRQIVQKGLAQLKYPEEECTTRYCRSRNRLLDNMAGLCDRIIAELKMQKPAGYEKKADWFLNMKEAPAKSLEEAFQRILFLNQMLWQTHHPLMGLGPLDFILDAFYRNDIEKGSITYQDAVDMILSFYQLLHNDYEFKSNALIGDTGQLIIVGRSSEGKQYWYNDLTFAFIEALEKIQLPDPKVVLRVSENIPRSLMETALKCIRTGVGAPLLANDDYIVPLLMQDGIEKEDAYNFTTAACWEPLAGWKCPISNNLTTLNFMKALDNLFKREPLDRISTFDELKQTYFIYLRRNLEAAKYSLSMRRFAYDPLVSTFMDGCYESKKDVSEGGTKYFDYGMTTVALGNAVDALLNIKHFVFEKNVFSLQQVRKMLLTDFKGCEEYVDMLRCGSEKYGCDKEQVIALANEILRFTTEQTRDFRNYNGGRLKFGLSSPGYIDAARGFDASFDGRRKNENFRVHISSDSADAYTELVRFASKLDYGENRYNGNVVDYMVSPSFIDANFDKFVDFLLNSIKTGFFEMQMNVMDSYKLIEAKKHPEKYPSLIVRVWGFSTYFHDLPEEYQDVLIQRALQSEGKA